MFCRFANFTAASDLLRLSQSVDLATGFGRADASPFLLLRRVPSETLQMRFATDSDALSDFSRRKDNVLVGARAISGAPLHHGKVPMGGKHPHLMYPSSPIFARCEGRAWRAISPFRTIFPRVATGWGGRGLLCPTLTMPNFNRILNRCMAAACFPCGELFPPQLLQYWWAHIKSAGFWRCMGCRIYIGDQMAGAVKISRA